MIMFLSGFIKADRFVPTECKRTVSFQLRNAVYALQKCFWVGQ